jgi:hypothetical protein
MPQLRRFGTGERLLVLVMLLLGFPGCLLLLPPPLALLAALFVAAWCLAAWPVGLLIEWTKREPNEFD